MGFVNAIKNFKSAKDNVYAKRGIITLIKREIKSYAKSAILTAKLAIQPKSAKLV